MKVEWSLLSQARLLEIEAYIAEDDPTAAARLVDRLIAKAEKLVNHPESGRLLPELPGSGLREVIEGNYRLIYRVRDQRVLQVVTVFEGHRLLREEELT